MESAKVTANQIGQIVFVTSTEFAFPGIDTDVINILGLPRNIHRMPLNFQGCSAGLRGMTASDMYCQKNPGNCIKSH